MNIEKNYDGKDLTILVENQIDTVTAPDFENEINDEMGKFWFKSIDCNSKEIAATRNTIQYNKYS